LPKDMSEFLSFMIRYDINVTVEERGVCI